MFKIRFDLGDICLQLTDVFLSGGQTLAGFSTLAGEGFQTGR